jgi:glutamyl-tRNA synthetase
LSTGRFAPSPSGPLHLGNLRTALAAWCWARHGGGRFLVRVEDLTTGAVPSHEAEQLEDLDRLGLHHDGEVVRQSERRDRYDAALARLAAADLLYRCVCSRRDVREAAAAPHGPDGPTYPGTCRRRSAAELDELVAAGRPAALRLRADGATVRVHDERAGAFEAVVDDLVVRRGDGTAAYNLAVVVDDAEQGVDQVVRGEDLLHTTPRQVLLQRLLGLPTPAYVHVPLVVGADGERLSKRNGAESLRQRLAQGERPAAVLGRLAASMGLAESGEELDAATVLERFDPGVVRFRSQLPPG